MSWDVMCSMVTTVNKTVLYIWTLLRKEILKVLITRKKIFVTTMDGCYLDLLWWSFRIDTSIKLLCCTPETHIRFLSIIPQKTDQLPLKKNGEMRPFVSDGKASFFFG